MKKFLLALTVFVAFLSVPSWAEIKRSAAAKSDFKYSHPCPANGHTKGPCPGYVIDHIKALACGGDDAPLNMQWQTIDEGKEKDTWERDLCEKNNIPENTRIPGDTNNDGYLSGSEQYLRDNPKTGKVSREQIRRSVESVRMRNNSSSPYYSHGGDSYSYGGSSYIHTGPRGGRYYINPNGNKTYIKR
jgi:hypothetical protein